MSQNLLALLGKSTIRNSTTRVVNAEGAKVPRLQTTPVPGQLQLNSAGAQVLRVGPGGKVVICHIEMLKNLGYAPTCVSAQGIEYFGVIFASAKDNDKAAKLGPIGNSYNFSSSNAYAELNGNGEQKEVYDLKSPVYGFAQLPDGSLVAVTSETPQDTPVEILVAFNSTTMNFDQVENATVAGDVFAEGGDFFCPLSFAKSVDKAAPRVAANKEAAAPAAPAAKAAPVEEAVPATVVDEEDDF